MTYPNFYCIGAQKAGTSWLYTILKQHPGVNLGPFKEAQYFSTLFCTKYKDWTPSYVRKNITKLIQKQLDKDEVDSIRIAKLADLMNPKQMFTDQWYGNLFTLNDKPGRIIGDITPAYSTLPTEGIEYMQRLSPQAKIIYLIRDPVSRALSQTRMYLGRGRKMETPEQLIHGDVLTRGDYMNYVPRWDKIFGDRVLYVPYKDISEKPAEVLKDIERHVGLPAFNYKNLDKRVHVTKKTEVAPNLVEFIREEMKDQYAFLRTRFGDSFLERI